MICRAGIGPDERLQARARRGLPSIRERFRLCTLHLCRTLRVQAMCRLRSMATTYKRKDSGYGTAPATPRQSPARRGLPSIRERFRLRPLYLCRTLRGRQRAGCARWPPPINGKIPAMPGQWPRPGEVCARRGPWWSSICGRQGNQGKRFRLRPLHLCRTLRGRQCAGCARWSSAGGEDIPVSSSADSVYLNINA